MRKGLQGRQHWVAHYTVMGSRFHSLRAVGAERSRGWQGMCMVIGRLWRGKGSG